MKTTKTTKRYLEPDQISRVLTPEKVNNLNTSGIDPIEALENQVMTNWDDPSNLLFNE